ncbi:glycoside hydrolase family 88 protein [Dyadobacter sp. CY345]|uniref:glycoside hydrolase family 88 protein n=1 Tax=Dyadobacter sp. CY345 TaxID=2909335 RepID=UPI001F2CC021|nr:glycoside hydrolase family 88 protein [Dyadobacter sp. CY345]MCF2443251.1 glycoside hydrolase family 88 protein [Dyadobacter sp. CY345]
MKKIPVLIIFLCLLHPAYSQSKKALDVDKELSYCLTQVKKTLAEKQPYNRLPRRISKADSNWNYVGIEDWTSGFWPGTLWYAYEYSKDNTIKDAAAGYTNALTPVLDEKEHDHDLGFMFYTSAGNGYRLTRDSVYRQTILRASDSLALLFNPKVGTILSWPRMISQMGWPHNTIMDNMINLEMLFWAAKNGGDKKLRDIAEKHAETTMKNHFRPDWTSYHVAVYDDKSGEFIKGVTHQGYADNSLWARGQAWAIYGFTMSARETGRRYFLETAQKTADVYIKNLPAGHVPYWDFNDPKIPDAPKDASAAAIVASGLLELSTLVKDKKVAQHYRAEAERMLTSLASSAYKSGDQNHAFLLHSTGHHPNGTEIDVSINYADYYYIEALTRLKKLRAGKSL